MGKPDRIAHILALDQGTTSSRGIVFDVGGKVIAAAQKEFSQSFPQPGWVEHDPMEIWSTQIGVAQEALAKGGLRAGDLSAIGIANQRETVVVWDRATGRPIHPAIVWQDRRTSAECDRLRAQGLESLVQERTGLLLDPYFSATKVRWILDHVPDARRRAENGELAFGTVDAWLIHQLTGGMHATDATNASRTLLFDIHRGAWDPELLSIFQIPEAILPRVCGSSEVLAETAEGLLGARVPIAGIAGDQQAATFGQACHRPGMAKNTYGTGCFLLLNTGQKAVASKNKLLTTVGWSLKGQTVYALEGSVFVAGAAVQWLRDGLGILRESSEVEALAGSVPDSGGVFVVPAFVGLGAPHWDSYARGSIFGLTRGSTAAHIARATLESIAFQTAEVLQAMEMDSETALWELRVDGGSASNDLLMQFQADMLGVPVVRPRVLETTALGAACLAGLAVGVWKDLEGVAATWQEGSRFEPRMSADERKQRMADWSRAVERAKYWQSPEA